MPEIVEKFCKYIRLSVQAATLFDADPSTYVPVPVPANERTIFWSSLLRPEILMAPFMIDTLRALSIATQGFPSIVAVNDPESWPPLPLAALPRLAVF